MGEPRPTALGFGAIPSENSTESYIAAFARAAQYGEVIVIQRAPPWADFLPNAQISQETIDTTALETNLLDQYGLKVVYAIDPTDPLVGRTRLANLPEGMSASTGFDNPQLRNAFVGYVRYIVRNYEPEYLALGVEVNMLRERDPAQFDSFVSLYREAYENAKDANPNTKVFPTFQLEEIEGTLDRIHPPDWQALDAFADIMDALAVSTYPYLGGLRTTQDLRPDYYTQLASQFEGEVLVVDAAYPSAPVDGYPIVGTQDDQDAFLQRLLGDAEAAGFSLVAWRAALDPPAARAGALAVFADIGLRMGDGSNKPAWSTWEAWARRPYTPAPQEDEESGSD